MMDEHATCAGCRVASLPGQTRYAHVISRGLSYQAPFPRNGPTEADRWLATPMPELKGEKLYVNLGATQTRRRLKGFGHGVRKVQSAGRNQAVIIHTATGQHLIELENVFADVGFKSREKTDFDGLGLRAQPGP
jgi:hypothetical protein